MIWPFTELKKLRVALAQANGTNAQSVENFRKLHDTSVRQGDLIDKLTAELEVERMRLVACGVGAACNTRESAHNARVNENNPYYCASVQDVYNAVDREMQLREDLGEANDKLERANDRAFRATEAHVATMGNFTDALDRLEDMLKGDDGQAWKEAEKFVLRHRGTKVCIKCGSEMIPMHSEDKKLCSNGACGHEVEWKLSEGQQYQYKRNVEPFVEDRSNSGEELEPPRSTLERL